MNSSLSVTGMTGKTCYPVRPSAGSPSGRSVTALAPLQGIAAPLDAIVTHRECPTDIQVVLLGIGCEATRDLILGGPAVLGYGPVERRDGREERKRRRETTVGMQVRLDDPRAARHRQVDGGRRRRIAGLALRIGHRGSPDLRLR